MSGSLNVVEGGGQAASRLQASCRTTAGFGFGVAEFAVNGSKMPMDFILCLPFLLQQIRTRQKFPGSSSFHPLNELNILVYVCI